MKMNEMHMKRKVPELYLSQNVRDGSLKNMNKFNQALRESLLTPQK